MSAPWHRAARAFGFVAVLAAAACSQIQGGPTAYAPIDPVWGNGYGYSDKRVGADEFSVFAAGNPASDAERVAEIALLRAAHLTLEHGHSHFVVVQSKARAVADETLVTVPIVLPGIFLPVPVDSKSTEEQVAILIVRLVADGAAVPPEGIDAAAVVTHLAPRLGVN